MLSQKNKRVGIFIFVILLVFVFIFLPFIVDSIYSKVEFNQFLLQDLEIKYRTASLEIFFDKLISQYSSGLNIILLRTKIEPTDLENTEEVFSYIFSLVPNYAVVYPTEGFYYFSTKINGVPLAGNIRIADLDKNKLSFAYFTINEGEPRQTWISNVTTEEGLKINKKSNYEYYVTYNGKKVRFKIPKTSVMSPEKIVLLREEEFVGQIHDESGVKLFLMFNHNTSSFYEILNDEEGTTDTFAKLDENYVIGKRTGFVYYIDKNYDRKILVGVHLKNTEENNYLDGPGDQVPFRANLKNKINIAYPSTLLDTGTDEYGVYLNKTEWVRIAISPYIRYNNPSEVLTQTSGCSQKLEKSIFWTCITKEWWNTREWREGIYHQLKEQNKTFTEVYFD